MNESPRLARQICCLVVDDDPIARGIISSYITRLPEWQVTGECDSGMAAYTRLRDAPLPDVIFLDIDMPDINGLDLIRLLKKQPFIVLITGSKDHAITAFELEVTDYLLKPVSFPRFLKCAERLQMLTLQRPLAIAQPPVQSRADHVFVKYNGHMHRLLFDDIQYIEAQVDYVRIITIYGNMLVYMSMKEVEEEFPADQFIRLHRSYIANFRKVSAVSTNSVHIGDVVLPVSASYRQKLQKIIGQ